MNSVSQLRATLRKSRKAIKSEWRKSRIPRLVSRSDTRTRWNDGSRNTYFITSDKGLFRCHSAGIDQVVDIHLYGCAIAGSRVFMGFHVDREAILVEGNADGLFKAGVPFDFRVIFHEFTSDTNERLHQVTANGDIVWTARTAAGAALRYDARTGSLTNFTLLRDRFGTPIKQDVNHINSVIQYGDVVLFTGARAGDRSIVGVLDDTKVTAYGYCNAGVHDIYLTRTGFLFFDTFGSNRPDEGGTPITEAGNLYQDIFSKPPGYVLRGAAQCDDEILIGSSHKGERTARFKGNGQLVIFERGRFRTVKQLPFAQVYQIMTPEGAVLEPPASPPNAAAVRAMLERSLGPPIYEGEAHVTELS